MPPKPESLSCTKSLVGRIVEAQYIFEESGISPDSDNPRAELINSVLAIQDRYDERSGLFNCIVLECSKDKSCPRAFEIPPPTYRLRR